LALFDAHLDWNVATMLEESRSGSWWMIVRAEEWCVPLPCCSAPLAFLGNVDVKDKPFGIASKMARSKKRSRPVMGMLDSRAVKASAPIFAPWQSKIEAM
jgi:hypothetical protein